MTSLFVAALSLASTAHAANCNATFGVIGPISTVTYDPFSGSSASVTFSVEAKNLGSESCNLSLAVASATTGDKRYFKKSTDKLRYLITTTDGDEYKNDVTQPRGSHSLSGGAGKTKIITVKVKVPSGQIGPWGTYTDNLTFRLFRNGSGSPVAMATSSPIPAATTIEKRAQINIAGSSYSSYWGVSSIDFDELQTNEWRKAYVQVRTTAGISIAIQSQNLGLMKHKTPSVTASVPYTMKLDGTPITLTSAALPFTRSASPSLEGVSYAMVLTVGNVTGKPAGEYKDLLTFTISP